MNAADIMTTTVLTASPASTVADMSHLMLTHNISGLPILDQGRLVGIVSEGDLLRRLAPAAPTGFFAALLSRRAQTEEWLHDHGATAADLMSTDVVSVSPDTSATEIARLLAANAIKRVPVLDDAGRLVGIVTRANLLRALAAQPQTPALCDRAIRHAVIAHLARAEWAKSLSPEGVIVAGGIVHLWGPVPDEPTARALVAAAQETPGVRSVVSHLTLSQ